ncbi:hypothetical protein ADP71_31730 [Vitreoscilla sp. C1]|uniref:hypothetical protein n=1 Tax=Vitreoscilla sp. (strain C1) TaxID=96942 RepID=UPI000CDC10E4|nr:hypothetical protein [Vitreoscilla sp. C1]AUZ06351.1 hypothetical protein ADP71_31730 [Vitreoscilla sp. C1]
MAKLTKKFYGVPNGEVYPIEYQKGDECPDELMAAAIELGAISAKDKTAWMEAEAERAAQDDKSGDSTQELKDNE